MENNSRSSYSVYAQIMQWERAQRLAEYKQQQELERLRTGSKPFPLKYRNDSNFSHSSRLQSSLKPKKHTNKTNVSVAIILMLGWLMGMLTHWAFIEFQPNLISSPVNTHQKSVGRSGDFY
ncbi:MAG: hypothetical protein VKK42_14940 [Lyngbya sp.]|nr:hypothetical protein [Lyngbya sp.]